MTAPRTARVQTENRDLLSTLFSVRDIRVRVTGAGARRVFVSELGRVLAQVRFAHGDAYVLGGCWFDDFDRVSAC